MTALFHCKRHPEGIIRTTAGLVTFRSGLAVVDDEALADALRQVPDAMGVTEHVPPAPPAPAPTPPAPPAPVPPAAPVEPVKPTPQAKRQHQPK
jgi:hypothetical protein